MTEATMIGRFEAHTLPDGSTIYFEPDDHAYYGEVKEAKSAKGGYSFVRASRLPGVSTIAKHLDASVEGLLYWAVKLDQIGIAKLAVKAIEEGRDLTWLQEQESIRRELSEAGLAWTDIRDQAAERGNLAHELQVAILTGEKASLSVFPEDQRPYGQALFKMVRDLAPKPVAIEKVTASPSKQFAGTFDLLADFEPDRFEAAGHTLPFEIDREFRVLSDAKSRESGKERRADHVQLVGYEEANVECGIGASDYRLAVLLLPDGNYKLKWCAATPADFYAALTAHRSGKHLDSRMRNPEKFYAEQAEREALVTA